MGFYEELIQALNSSLEENFDGKMSHMGKACDVHPTTLKRLLSGERSKWAQMLGRVADAAGVSPSAASTNQTREVCYVAPKRLSVEDVDSPIPEDYIAVPLAVGEVAAGSGMVPQDFIKSWVLVWKNHESVRLRSNLVAVEVGKGQTSMTPTLHPQDILLVDRDDYRDRFKPPGNIFLVRDPDGDGGVAVKRVTVKPNNGDLNITFYSDNAIEHPPTSFSLEEDFEGEISRAIVGRVVWAWSDMSRK